MLLQTFFDVAPSYLACQFFIQGLALHFALLATAIIWSRGTYIILLLMNCYGITKLFFTFIENQTFLRNFYTTKVWSHTITTVIQYLALLMYLQQLPYKMKYWQGVNFGNWQVIEKSPIFNPPIIMYACHVLQHFI